MRVALVLVLVGCGGSSDHMSPPAGDAATADGAPDSGACPTLEIANDVTWHTSSAANIAPVTKVTGTITIVGDSPNSSLTLTCLESAGGLKLTAGTELLVEFHAPRLQEVTGDLAVLSDGLAALDTPSLVSVGGTLSSTDSDLADLSALHLTTLGGLDLSTAEHLASLHGLEGVSQIPGNIHIGYGPLTLEGLAGLTSVGGNLTLELGGWTDSMANPIGGSLAGLERLETVGGDATLSIGIGYATAGTNTSALGSLTTVHGTLEILAGEYLTSISLPRLEQVSALRVKPEQPSPATHVTSLVAPALTSAPVELTITGLSTLAKCYADNILSRLVPAPANVSISGLDMNGTCP